MEGQYDWVIEFCTEHVCDDPMRIFRMLMHDERVLMHGPVHHAVVPMVLITAVWSIRRDFDLESHLREAAERASDVPPAVCGLWGCCGSAIGVGIFHSIMTRTGPLSKGRRWGQCNDSTSKALCAISVIGGPRCCKRNAALAIASACESAEPILGVSLVPSRFVCTHHDRSAECIGSKCPFFPVKTIPKDDYGPA